MPGTSCSKSQEIRREIAASMASIRASIEAAAPDERLRLIAGSLHQLNLRRQEAMLQLPVEGCGGRCLTPSFRSAARYLEKERALNLQRHEQTLPVINLDRRG